MSLGVEVAQERQTQATPWASTGTLWVTPFGMAISKHQHFELPSTMPHWFGCPHSGHFDESTAPSVMNLSIPRCPRFALK